VLGREGEHDIAGGEYRRIRQRMLEGGYHAARQRAGGEVE
jgi:hypothetical protein